MSYRAENIAAATTPDFPPHPESCIANQYTTRSHLAESMGDARLQKKKKERERKEGDRLMLTTQEVEVAVEGGLQDDGGGGGGHLGGGAAFAGARVPEGSRRRGACAE